MAVRQSLLYPAPISLNESRIERTVVLNLSADWGWCNFHRTQSWLTQEFCSRAETKKSNCDLEFA